MNLETYYITLRDLAILFVNLMLFKYYVFLLLAPMYSLMELGRQIRIRKKGINLETYRPLVSVIVPAWNEEVGVLKTVNSIIENTYDNTEIIVINDGSSDNTGQIVQNFVDTYRPLPGQPPIRFIDKIINAGKGEALNSGISAAEGEIVLTVDSDSAVDKEAIANLVKYFADDTIDGVVGNVKVANANSIVGQMQKLEYIFGFYFKRAYAVLGAEYIFGGACAAFRRKVFEDIGLYDTQNKTEDIEMTMRFRAAGYKCTYAQDVICYTEGASTFMGLINQRLRWKKGRIDTFLKYRNLFFSTNRQHNKFLCWFILPFAMLSEIQLFFEPIFIAFILGYSFITLDFISLSFGLLFLFVLYLIAALFSGEKIKLSMILLFPFTWILFYFLVWIEFLALIRSTILVLRGQSIEWQRWNRQGI